jgi:hypothetical protein
MNKYIQDTIRNKSRSVLKDLSVPQQKAVNEMVRGLFTAGEPILRHLAQDETKSVKKQAEKYSHHLGNMSLQSKVEALTLKEAQCSIHKTTIIAYDLTDVNKELAEKMEKLSKVWDGSQKKVAPGFLVHGVGINNVLVKLEVHDSDAHTTNQIRRNIIEILSKKFQGRGIWVFDRGNDDKQFFKFLRQEAKVSFIARLKENRQVVLKESGVKIQVKDLEPGKYQVYLMQKFNVKVDESAVYTLVISKHLEECEPIRLLHNLHFNFSPKKIVTMYLERWGVENMFKRVKEKFGLEKIRVLKYQKFVTLIALIQLVVLLSTVIFSRIQQSTHLLITGVLLYYRNFLKLKSLSFNLESFISFLKSSLKPFCFRNPAIPNQLTLFPQNYLELTSF